MRTNRPLMVVTVMNPRYAGGRREAQCVHRLSPGAAGTIGLNEPFSRRTLSVHLSRKDHRLESSRREPCIDLARGRAVLGIFAAHLMVVPGLVWTEPGTWLGLVEWRSFILPGASLGVHTRSSSNPPGIQLRCAYLHYHPRGSPLLCARVGRPDTPVGMSHEWLVISHAPRARGVPLMPPPGRGHQACSSCSQASLATELLVIIKLYSLLSPMMRSTLAMCDYCHPTRL